jgi:hypothetical protein
MNAEIHARATDAARAATAATLAAWGGEDRGSCGFAWVTVSGIRLNTKIGQEFAALGFRKGHGVRAPLTLSNPSRYPGQNIDCKEAGAAAYAAVLHAEGYDAFWSSRLD